MKKTIITSFLVCSIGFVSTFAQTDITVPAPPDVSSVSSFVENKEAVQEKRLDQLNRKANRLIDERIRALEANTMAITKNKDLTAEQKNLLVAELATTTKALTALKSTLVGKDATSTKAIIDTLYNDYRVYGIVIPKVRLDVRLYQLKNHSLKVSDAFLKLQSQIDAHKAKGHDVTTWQANLEKAKQRVAENMFTIDSLLSETKTLTPLTYGTSSMATIRKVNKDIQVLRKEFNTIQSTVRKPSSFKKAAATSTQMVNPLR